MIFFPYHILSCQTKPSQSSRCCCYAVVILLHEYATMHWFWVKITVKKCQNQFGPPPIWAMAKRKGVFFWDSFPKDPKLGSVAPLVMFHHKLTTQCLLIKGGCLTNCPSFFLSLLLFLWLESKIKIVQFAPELHLNLRQSLHLNYTGMPHLQTFSTCK